MRSKTELWNSSGGVISKCVSRCKLKHHNEHFDMIRTVKIGSGVEDGKRVKECFEAHLFPSLPSLNRMTNFDEVVPKYVCDICSTGALGG